MNTNIFKYKQFLAFWIVLLFYVATWAAQWSDVANSSHSFKDLGSDFYVDVPMSPIKGARLVLFNKDAAARLGIEIPQDPKQLEKVILDNFAIFVDEKNPSMKMMATYYMDSGKKAPGEALGDGRAVWVGELNLGNNAGVDFVLKGIGVTPLAWTNHSDDGHKDGLQSRTEAIHSFIHSEANFRNGLDSTVDLAVIEIPLKKKNKYTGEVENATITLRAGDQFRLAHLAYHADNPENFKKFFAYIMKREFHGARTASEYLQKFSENLAEEAARYYDLHAVHGSPTLGNRTLSGATIDMGTFRYLDAHHSDYAYLFGRLSYKNQTEQLRKSCDYMIQYLRTAGVVTAVEAQSLTKRSLSTFNNVYKDTLVHLWLKRLGLNDTQIAKIRPTLIDDFFIKTIAMYEAQSATTSEVAGKEMRPAVFDMRHVFKKSLDVLASHKWKKWDFEDSFSGRDWQSQSQQRKLTWTQRWLTPSIYKDRTNLKTAYDFAEVVSDIFKGLNLSEREWRTAYQKNKEINKNTREVLVDDIFFQKEKDIARMISENKSFTEISDVALNSVNQLVDHLSARRYETPIYKAMAGINNSSAVHGSLKCEAVFH